MSEPVTSDWGQFTLLTRCSPSFLETGEFGFADKVSASAFDDMSAKDAIAQRSSLQTWTQHDCLVWLPLQQRWLPARTGTWSHWPLYATAEQRVAPIIRGAIAKDAFEAAGITAFETLTAARQTVEQFRSTGLTLSAVRARVNLSSYLWARRAETASKVALRWPRNVQSVVWS